MALPIRLRGKQRFDQKRVRLVADRAIVNGLGHAGALIRKIARQSIKPGAKASAAGQPPHTRRGQLKRAILFTVERKAERVVIGPAAEMVGDSGKAHEFGGLFRGQRYPIRPFMRPALDESLPRLPAFWRTSVK